MKTLVLLFAVSVLLLRGADAQFGAMSIDLGTQFIKVGLVKPGVPMEIVLNKESRRKSPHLLSIRNGERVFSDAALALQVRFPQTVYGNILDLLAKPADHPIVEQYRQRFPQIKMETNPNNSQVVFPVGDEKYSVETLLAMTLADIKHVTEAFAEQPVKDAVITIPAYWNQAERSALATAAKIAKLNLLQLVADGSAAALSHGVFRRKEITDEGQTLLVYDMGAQKTVATLVEFKLVKEKYGKEPRMTVLGVGFDRTLGGLELTVRLRDHLIEKVRATLKTETDVTTNARAMAKLWKEAERVKQVLSANADHYAQIESVHEEKDMRIHVTRDELNALMAGLEERMQQPIYDALAMAGVDVEKVDQVVLMGAGTRVPKVQEQVQKAIGSKEIGRFLNTDEAAAMGALFQAAHLSKGFKVKPFHLKELVLHPIQVNFVSKQQEEGSDEVVEKAIQRQLFQYKTSYPTSKKILSFTSYTDDFAFDLNYGDMSHFKKDQLALMGPLNISEIVVSGLGKTLSEKLTPEETEFKGVKAAFSLDESGLVQLSKVEAVIQKKPKSVIESITNTISGFFSSTTEEGEPKEEEKEQDKEEGAEEKKEQPEEKTEEKPATEEKEQKTEEKTGEEKPEEAKTAGNSTETDGAGDKKDEKKETKKKEPVAEEVRVKLNVTRVARDAQPMEEEHVKHAAAILDRFAKEERLRAERQAAENELEAYAFEASQLGEEEEFVKYSTEEEREKVAAEASRVRTWLEDEAGVDTKTHEFTKNLNAIKDLVRPVKKRIDESKSLPAALESMTSQLNSTLALLNNSKSSLDSEFPMWNATDVEAFEKKVTKVQEWFAEKEKEQEKKAANEDPALMTQDVLNKIKVLERETRTLFKKMTTINLDKLKKAADEAKKQEEKKNGDEKKEAEREEKKTEQEPKKEESAEPIPETPKGEGEEKKTEL